MDKLLVELLSPFAGRLVATFSAVSIAFWGVGMTVVHLGHWLPLDGLCLVRGDFCGLTDGRWKEAAGPVGAALVVIVVLSTIVLALAPAVLKFLHSGGPLWRTPGIRRQRRARELHKRLAQDGEKHRCSRYPHGVPSKKAKRSRRDWVKGLFTSAPGADSDTPPKEPTFVAIDVPLQPTRLANVFAATQQRIVAKHGLRMNSCRRLLVEVMPARKRAELEALTGAVLRRVHTMTWFLVAIVWAPALPGYWWMLWVAACLVMAHWMYREVCQAACECCDALEAVVAVQRHQLYRAVGFPLPASTADEPRCGAELSGYLDRSTEVPHTVFAWSGDSGTSSAATAEEA